jgi:large subunit ribosomal protein L10
MPAPKKVEAVEELTEILGRSTTVVSADYRGLTVAETTAMRKQFRESGLAVAVIKNTLFRLAAKQAGKDALSELADGPTALVIGFDDALAPLKVVTEYQRTARNAFQARKAYVDGQVYTGAALNDLATLPPRETLLAEFAGSIASPITTFAYLLQATIQEFAGLLDSRAAQLEAAG